MATLRVATCQFPVSASIDRNLEYVCRQTAEAAAAGAQLVHFPEAALSGYAGVNLDDWAGFDWDRLRTATEAAQARRWGVWLVVGSAHPLSLGCLPHNAVYVFGPDGAMVDRYDKRFCTGQDLKYYTPGDHFVVFDASGVRCGVLICHDFRYPELYREYYRLGAQCLL